MNLPPGSRDLVRIVLGILLIVLLIGGSLWILGPFLPALIWATMIVVATWPLLLRLQRALGGRRTLAAAVMTALLLLIVVAPLAVAVSTIVRQAARLTDIRVAEIRIPMPPVWIEGVPVVGAKVTAEWRVYAAATPEELASKAAPYMTPVVGWIAARAGSLRHLPAPPAPDGRCCAGCSTSTPRRLRSACAASPAACRATPEITWSCSPPARSAPWRSASSAPRSFRPRSGPSVSRSRAYPTSRSSQP